MDAGLGFANGRGRGKGRDSNKGNPPPSSDLHRGSVTRDTKRARSASDSLVQATAEEWRATRHISFVTSVTFCFRSDSANFVREETCRRYCEQVCEYFGR